MGTKKFTTEMPATDPYDSAKAVTSNLQFFPNPVHDEVRLYVTSDKNESMSLSIYDSNGFEVFQDNRYRTNELITIPNEWRPGVYIVRVRYGNVTEEKKILKI